MYEWNRQKTGNKKNCKEQREIAFNNLKKKRVKKNKTIVELSFSNNNSDIVDVYVGHTSTSKKRKRGRGRQNFVCTEIATALDRTRVSD